VSGQVAETEAEASDRQTRESRQAFDQGYARASAILQEKLKGLARAAAQLIEAVERPESPPLLRSVLNDILTVLAAAGIKPSGELGAATAFDPASHEDISGGLVPGDSVIIAGVGFILETSDAGKEYLRRIRVSARPTGG
jgi:hypothetical protein